MSDFSALLAKGAKEIRSYRLSENSKAFDDAWLDSLAERLEAASTMEADRVEREISIIARLMIDSGPSWDDAAPSFGQAVGALQRRR
jgi:hypothetical protein